MTNFPLYSNPCGLCPAMGSCGKRPHRNRLRADDNVYSNHELGTLDWIPDFGWYWTRFCSSNG